MAIKSPPIEFSRPFEVAKLPNSGSHEKIEANAKECEKLAERLQVPALHGLTAKLHVKPWRGGGVKVQGELQADIEQVSVVSLETFRQTISFLVERYFVSAGQLANSAEDEDLTDEIEAGTIDLGELVSETLALELDPYPRKPGETFTASGDEPEPKAPPNPFAKLAKLRQDPS